MEIVYILVGIAIGAIIGFIANKKFSADSQELQRLEEQANNSKNSLDEYKKQVASHLENSAELLAQMNETCKIAMVQMEKSTSLLNKATTEPVAMPFFSKEAQAHLNANQASKEKVRPSTKGKVTEPPLDYSSAPSGLFDDSKQIVTNSPS